MSKTLSKVAVAEVSTSRNALRLAYDPAEIDALAASIDRIGLISPIVVMPDGKGYAVIAGHRRLVACEKLKWEYIPAIVLKSGSAEVKETALAENMFRADLTPVEVACGVKDCIEAGIMTEGEIAQAMHRSNHWVQRQLELLTWPADVLDVIQSGQLSVAAAENLALIPDDAYRDMLVRTAVENGATARSTAAWLQAYRMQQPPEMAIEKEPVPAGSRPAPALPQAPCLACGQVQRTDALSMVMICSSCINAIRGAIRD